MAPRRSKKARSQKKPQKGSLQKFNVKQLQNTEFYCLNMKCRCRVNGKNVKIENKRMPNGCPRVKGKCQQCGNVVYRILAKDTPLK